MKTCQKCKEEKDEACFNKRSAPSNKRETHCKDCREEYRKQYYKDHKEEILLKGQKYRAENKEKLRLYEKSRPSRYLPKLIKKTRPKTTEQFIIDATAKHNGRYDYSKVEYVGAHKKIIIICKHHGEFAQTPKNHLFGRNNKGQGCPKCMIVEKFDNLRLNNDIIDEDLIKNKTPIKRLGDYTKNSAFKIDWQCLKCDNIWKTSPNSIRNGYGCPICNDTKLNSQDIDNFINVNNLEIKRIGSYTNSYTKIKWECLKCNYIWIAKPSEITRQGDDREGSGCPHCARGKNEKRVAEVLNELNISHQRIRIDLESGKKIFPDFYLKKYNIIIEYNGVQHYKPIQFGSLTINQAEENFKKQQIRDELMRDYCFNNNIILLEIDGREYKGNKLKSFVKDYMKEVNYE